MTSSRFTTASALIRRWAVAIPRSSIHLPHRVPDPPENPLHDRTVRVTQCGRICIGKRKINLSIVFAGQFVGIREVADKIWLVSFLDFDLGYFDGGRRTGRARR